MVDDGGVAMSKARSPLEALIDAVVKCLRCGQSIAECSCPQPEMVRLECPKCGRWKMTEKAGLEPLVEGGKVLARCRECKGKRGRP